MRGGEKAEEREALTPPNEWKTPIYLNRLGFSNIVLSHPFILIHSDSDIYI